MKVKCPQCRSTEMHREIIPPNVIEMCQNGHPQKTLGQLNYPQLDNELPYFFYLWPQRYTVFENFPER